MYQIAKNIHKLYTEIPKCDVDDLFSENADSGEGHLSFEDFAIPTLTCLGEGEFGKVYCARGRRRGLRNRIALKVLPKGETNNLKDVKTEVQIMTSLPFHENILQLYSYFADKGNIYLVLEFISGGNLHDLEKPFSADMSARFIRDICNGLSHCHQHKIIHRDLKSDNLMLCSEKGVKIIDFGCANFFEKHGNTECGSVLYYSPEMLNARKGPKYGYSVDIWPIGVLLFEFLTGKLPFGESDYEKVAKNILGLNICWPKEGDISDSAKDLISKLLVADPSKRLPLVDVTRHAFIQENLD